MAAFIYEGVLLFGVLFFAAFAYSVLTQQHHGMQGRSGLAAYLFIVLGLYFVGFWTHGGQTLALKTWHLKVVDAAGRPLTVWRATARYLLAWLWFIPALASVSMFGLHGAGAILAITLAGVVGYALLARAHPQGLLLHEALSGTRVISQLPTRP